MAEIHRDVFPAGQYFLGVAGMAAMRDILRRPSEGRDRVADVRSVIDGWDAFPNDIEIEVVQHDVDSGYAAWAPDYDGPNPAIEVEEPVVRAMIDALGGERALDAACGTGRHAGYLSSSGFETIGVDATPEMLAVGRAAFPEVDFREGRFESLPVDEASVDVVTSGLAVCHAPDLGPVFAEFARVLRPGGSVIVSDPHPTSVTFSGVAGFRDPAVDPAEGFTMSYIENLRHPMHTYVNAAVAAGLEVVECREPVYSRSAMAANPAFAILPDAVEQAFGDFPFVVVWRMRKPG